jgi:hypothetical protein
MCCVPSSSARSAAKVAKKNAECATIESNLRLAFQSELDSARQMMRKALEQVRAEQLVEL